MYLFFISINLCIAYFGLYFLFPYFFENKIRKLTSKSFYSISAIIILSLIGYHISAIIPNFELSNRFLHAFGGGFMGFFVCFLVAKDSLVKISKFKFLLFSAMIVLTLGIGNEIMEFTLQNTTSMIFSTHINDTWLDLISNTVGVLVGALCFTPFIQKH